MQDDQGGEEPAVTQESHSELNGKFHICRVNVDIEAAKTVSDEAYVDNQNS